jgi:tetratricopeptide (TPR) repeat protein
MGELINSQLSGLSLTNQLRKVSIYVAGALFFGAVAFSHEISAQKSAAPSARQVSVTQTANQAKADKLIGEAAALQKENTNVAKRRALAKYKQAAALLRNNRPPGDFIALSSIAKLYKELNEPDQAIAYWQQSLARLRTGADRNPEKAEAEGVILLQIGAVYDERGEREKALEHYRQALDLTRANKGYAAAGALNGIVTLYIKAKHPERAAAFLEQEIARARAAQDKETEKALEEVLNEIRRGTFKN